MGLATDGGMPELDRYDLDSPEMIAERVEREMHDQFDLRYAPGHDPVWDRAMHWARMRRAELQREAHQRRG